MELRRERTALNNGFHFNGGLPEFPTHGEIVAFGTPVPAGAAENPSKAEIEGGSGLFPPAWACPSPEIGLDARMEADLRLVASAPQKWLILTEHWLTVNSEIIYHAIPVPLTRWAREWKAGRS